MQESASKLCNVEICAFMRFRRNAAEVKAASPPSNRLYGMKLIELTLFVADGRELLVLLLRCSAD
jgi:hypothetical protein